jgi:hypothetical protein
LAIDLPLTYHFLAINLPLWYSSAKEGEMALQSGKLIAKKW